MIILRISFIFFPSNSSFFFIHWFMKVFRLKLFISSVALLSQISLVRVSVISFPSSWDVYKKGCFFIAVLFIVYSNDLKCCQES